MVKKKIVFIINSLSCGGAERVLINIVNNLNPELFDITVVTTFGGGEFSSFLSENVHLRGVTYYKNKYVNVMIYKFLAKLCTRKFLYKLYIKESYDIEVAFLEGLPTKVISGSMNAKSQKIAWVHIDLETHKGSDYCFKNIKEQKACYSKFNKIICVSDGVSKIFINRFGFSQNTEVYTNPIDEKSIISNSNEKNNLYLNEKKLFSFVAVGRLVKQKGFDRLIKIMAQLRDNGIKCNVSIIGEGVERSNLELMISNYNLVDEIQLLGYKNNPYMYMKQADAFVLSSRAEGYGLVVAEALILGIPVVAMNCAGVDGILLNGEYGILVENNEEELYEGMKKIVTDSAILEHYRNKAQIRGKEFSIKNSIKKVEKLLNEN